MHARNSPDSSNLGLGRLAASILWQGIGGLRWGQLLSRLKTLLRFVDPPQLLVIHCGGNDIGQISSCVLRHEILKTLHILKDLLPTTRFIWSSILPRLFWRGEKTHKAVDKIRIRTNSQIGAFVMRQGGGYIRYPEIVEDNELFLDGVHLNTLGNNLFCFRLQQALHTFLTSNQHLSPPPGENGPWQMINDTVVSQL